MKNKHIIIIVLIGLILIFGYVSLYNGLVSKEESVTSQWANVENAYQRRADLITNLVATVKGYAEHEHITLMDVIEARSKATSFSIKANELTEENIAKFQQLQEGVSNAVSRLLVSVERYPDLKANQNFLALQEQLEGTENRISTERRKYNETTQKYNTSIRKFPSNIIASLAGFEKKGYFKAEENANKVPQVHF